jgi:hypothetical protein
MELPDERSLGHLVVPEFEKIAPVTHLGNGRADTDAPNG